MKKGWLKIKINGEILFYLLVLAIFLSSPGSVYANEMIYGYIDNYDAVKLPLSANIVHVSYDRDEGRSLLSGARKLSDGLDRLVDNKGDALPLSTLNTLTKQSNLRYENGKVRVVIHLAEEDFDFKTGSKATMGSVEFDLERQVGKRLQALVAVDDLIDLADSEDIVAITAPQLPEFYAITSEGAAIIGADELHNSGIEGQGVTIGILDGGFYGYESLLGTELPSTVDTQSFYPGGDITGGGVIHGTGVAEIVHDVAPEASLVLVNYQTNLDFPAAVDWLIAQDVDVITTSTGFITTGPMDGTDAIARKANDARNAGIIFDAASGNYGSKHHYKQFTPSNNPLNHDFYGNGGNVGHLKANATGWFSIPADYPIIVDMVWDDWGTDPDTPTSSEDYDLLLVMLYNSNWYLVASSEIRQNGAAFPRERIGVYAPVTAFYAIIIEKNSTTSDHFLNVFSNIPFGTSIQNPERSVVTPCVGEKVLCIGATGLSDNIRPFSSQGPTIPNEITHIALSKPDLTAPDGVSTATYGTLGFSGTSASASHVGGAAALYLQMADMNPAEAESQLIADAVDLGVPGWDPVYGHGRLRMEVLDYLQSFNISLTQGWNLVSSPLNFTNITEIFEPIEDDFISMFVYDGEEQKFIEIDPFSDVEIDLRYGAWIKVSENIILSITGEEFENTDIPLFQGWNLVGHPYLEERDVLELFENDSVYSYKGSWSSHIPGRAFNSLGISEPGYGYWVME